MMITGGRIGPHHEAGCGHVPVIDIGEGRQWAENNKRGLEPRLFRVGSGSARQPALTMANVVSGMRFEKPHSLSYQDTTRHSVPSTTCV